MAKFLRISDTCLVKVSDIQALGVLNQQGTSWDVVAYTLNRELPFVGRRFRTRKEATTDLDRLQTRLTGEHKKPEIRRQLQAELDGLLSEVENEPRIRENDNSRARTDLQDSSFSF